MSEMRGQNEKLNENSQVWNSRYVGHSKELGYHLGTKRTSEAVVRKETNDGNTAN